MKRVTIYIRTEEDGFIELVRDAQLYDLKNPVCRLSLADRIQMGLDLVQDPLVRMPRAVFERDID